MRFLPKHRKRRHCSTLAILTAAASLSFAPAFAQADANRTMTPTTIADAVDDELLFDHAVTAHRVDVNVADGIVTLTGEVNSLLASHRAAEIATTVKGVRAVVNRLDVRVYEDMTDKQIRQNVSNALLNDPATDSYEVAVTVNDGVVTLKGDVDSFQEKHLSEKVARGVKGVREINNKIDIDFDEDRLDTELRKEIAQLLRWNTLIDDALIDVKVDGGNVTLTGTVGSAAEKRRAQYAAYISGVTDVNVENLDVEGWARDERMRDKKYVVRRPDEIRDAIRDAMLYDPRVNSFDIDVTVAGSTATLRGVVDNVKARRAAASDARNVVGVNSITNRIKVRPQENLTDSDIESLVTAAMLRSPIVERYELDIEVVDGTAYLSGDVDTYLEKLEAADVAERTNGVINVVNNLAVFDPTPLSYDPYTYETYPYDYDWYTYEPTRTFTDDEQIKEDIESQLFWSPFVDSDDVNVVVDNGEAILTGEVDTWSEFSAATENAYEGGATWVDNDLEVDMQ